jgi:hypothetical protein
MRNPEIASTPELPLVSEMIVREEVDAMSDMTYDPIGQWIVL